ncbi:MAG: regulatory protein RecX [Puia sp.]|nr:regulatory protein RecX [Puia sp.]
MIGKQRLTREQALQKARHYCAYQERCHTEVRDKLYSFGLWKNEVEETLSGLVEEDYLNEERFAIQFAGGHFRMKQWGRVKIRYELKQKRVSEYCIKKALKEIGEEDYLKSLEELAKKKWEALKGDEGFARYGKLQDYLMRKGYEPDLIRETIKAINAIP